MDVDGVIDPREDVSQTQLFFMTFYWLSHLAQWAGVLFVLVPAQVSVMVGENQKATYLSLLVMSGGIVSLFASPLIGALSDRLITTRGKRLPWLIVGCVGNILSLVGLAFSAKQDLFVLFVFIFALLNLSQSAIITPYAAIIPDSVPRRQFGTASTYLSIMTLVGILAGSCLTILAVAFRPEFWLGYVVCIAFVIIGAILCLLVLRERKDNQRPLPPFNCLQYITDTLRPFRNRNFSLIFWTRLFMITGQYLIVQFLQFFLKDAIVQPYHFFNMYLTEDQGFAWILFLSVSGSVVASVLSGKLSDYIGRKTMVGFSGILQVASIIACVFVRDYTQIAWLSLLMGIGTGTYMTVAWALMFDVLPSKEYARDMGIWGATATVPQIIATPIMGLVIDAFTGTSGKDTGYTIFFSITAALVAIGTIPVFRININKSALNDDELDGNLGNTPIQRPTAIQRRNLRDVEMMMRDEESEIASQIAI